ncbi:MAG TPA: hypothetical protein VM933_11520 [Acidimicrobiales bacterium]|nr:hypothetical protein [Acidimicrobiales bacterium]
MAAACIAVLVAGVACVALGLLAFLALAVGDDTLGLGLLAVFGPFALAGLGAVVQVIVALSATARRAWRRDGGARVEVGLVGLAALLLLVPAYLGSAWWPLLLGVVPAVALVGLAAWPGPWRPAETSSAPPEPTAIRWAPDADPST